MQFNSMKFAALLVAMWVLSEVCVAAGVEQSAVEQIRTIQIKATGSRYEPLQYITPYLQSRHVSDYGITVTWSPAAHQIREDWNLNTIYPFPAKLSFWAVYHEHSGERMGRDGFRPSTEGPVQPARIGAVFKDLWLSNPLILAAYADTLPATSLVRDGVHYERRLLSAYGTQWSLLVEAKSALPVEISTLENDPLEGEVTNRIIFSDWREVSGIPFPFKLEQYIDGKIIRRETRQSITVNPAEAEHLLNLTLGVDPATDEDLRQWGWSMSNFFLRRMAMGAPADEDQSLSVRFSEVGEGIYQVLGSSHHNLLIVGPDGLAIVEAVWYPRRSESILRELRRKWPDKPLKYVILTHHHLDHSGGLLPFVRAGALVVTAKNNEPYFNRILSRSSTQAAMLMAVGNKAVLNSIGRTIAVYDVLNSHVNGMLAVYVPDQKLLFNSDLYSPGRPTQQKVWAQELLDAIEFYELDVKTHVGGHGMGTKPHEHLVELTGSK